MSRSDYGKPRQKFEKPEDDNFKRGILGPFLVSLSGYAPSRNKREWYKEISTLELVQNGT